MKSVEEEFILKEIEKLDKRRIEYLEADRNALAETYELKLNIWNNIYNLVEDGYKYRAKKSIELRRKIK